MPKVNVYLPDDLAEQVRIRQVPLSAVCQAALRNYLDLQTADVDDIRIVIDAPAGSIPVIDETGRPILQFDVASGRPCWTLWYTAPGGGVEVRPLGADAGIVPVEEARAWLRRVRGEPLEKITVPVGPDGMTMAFMGRWLVEPDRDETRTRESGYDAGGYWGVALTQRGRFAVYAAHCNDQWPAWLHDFDTLDDARGEVPQDILALAGAGLGESREVWRDI